MRRRVFSKLTATICTAVVATMVLSGCDSAQLSLGSDEADTEESVEQSSIQMN